MNAIPPIKYGARAALTLTLRRGSGGCRSGGFLWPASSVRTAESLQAFLINFLLWSAMAQGAVLFSAVTHVVKAAGPVPEWAGGGVRRLFPHVLHPLPDSFLGKNHVFPWLGRICTAKDLAEHPLPIHARCGRSFGSLRLRLRYLSQALQAKLDPHQPASGLRRLIAGDAPQGAAAVERIKKRMSLWAGLYCFTFALVLSLIGFDLIMSMDPHWISTLFGAYHFVKAFYVGLGALIILAAVIYLQRANARAHSQPLS
jgi:hypothetical protein